MTTPVFLLLRLWFSRKSQGEYRLLLVEMFRSGHLYMRVTVTVYQNDSALATRT